MNQNEFQRLVEQGFNRIPVAREVLADLDTPLSTYLKLADAPYSYLLESVQGGEKWGRYSIIGLPCRKIIRVRGQRVTVEHAGEIVEALDCPIRWPGFRSSRPAIGCRPPAKGLPRFIGGLVGYFGYDTIRYVEPKLARCPNPDPVDNPDILLLVSEDMVVFDNLAGRLYLITLVDPAVERAYSRAQQRLDDWSATAAQPALALCAVPLPSGGARDRIRLRLHPGRFRERGAANQGIHPGRRLHAGGAVAAAVRAVPGRAAGSVPGAARAESLALHVFPQPGRFPHRRVLAGNSGAAGGRRC